VVAGLGGFIKVNLKKEIACGDNFHAGYFNRSTPPLLDVFKQLFFLVILLT